MKRIILPFNNFNARTKMFVCAEFLVLILCLFLPISELWGQEKDNVKFSVEVHNLYNKVYVIQTRDKANSYILDPIVLDINLTFPKGYNSIEKRVKEFGFTLEPYLYTLYRWSKKSILFFRTTKCINETEVEQIATSFWGPITLFYNTSDKKYTSILVTNDSNQRPNFCPLYEIIDRESKILDDSSTSFSYKIAINRAYLPMALNLSTLKMKHHYSLPNKEDLYSFNASNYEMMIESDLFKLPEMLTDTELIVDRADTLIDYMFYVQYPYRKTDVIPLVAKGIYSFPGIRGPMALSDSIFYYTKIKSKVKQTRDGFLLLSKKFKAEYFMFDSSQIYLNKLTYYPKGNEYLFFGLYSNDSPQYVQDRIFHTTCYSYLKKEQYRYLPKKKRKLNIEHYSPIPVCGLGYPVQRVCLQYSRDRKLKSVTIRRH